MTLIVILGLTYIPVNFIKLHSKSLVLVKHDGFFFSKLVLRVGPSNEYVLVWLNPNLYILPKYSWK